jgi:hypothetical protein
MQIELDTMREAIRIAYAKGYAQCMLDQSEASINGVETYQKHQISDDEVDTIWHTAVQCT